MPGQVIFGTPPPEAPDQILERAQYPVPPEIRAIFDEARAGKDKILKDGRLKDSAKQELVREVEDAARVRFDAAFEKLHAAKQKDLDREEGQARAELLNAAPTFDIASTERERLATLSRQIHRHAALAAESNALHLVSVAPDVEELRLLFDEAEGRQQGGVMAAATFRAEALAMRARQKDGHSLSPSPAQLIASDMRTRLIAFRREHPSPSERLRAIDGQRERITAEHQRAKGWWFRAYGWSGPTFPIGA